MMFNKGNLIWCTAVAVVLCGIVVFGLPEQAKPGGKEKQPKKQPEKIAAGLPPFQQRDLRTMPPEVESATVQLLEKLQTQHANAILSVKFKKGQGLPEQLIVQLDERIVLRDDGREGDETAGDGIYTGRIHVDVKALEKDQARLAPVKDKPVLMAVFDGRTKLKSVKAVPVIDLEALRGFKTVPIRLPIPFGLPTPIDPEKSLMITDLKVVEDPARTFNFCEKDPAKAGTPMGKWTFGFLMEQLANTPQTGVTGSQFARRWLRRWQFDQTINDWTVKQRPGINDVIIKQWEKSSGVPAGGPLDLSKAPFRLLAIVNRIDLHENLAYGGGSAGEGRFVFCAMDENCNPLRFTVIFEYGIKKQGCLGLKSWAKQWADLSLLPLGDPAYNAALQAITDQFSLSGSDPTRPNGSALNQLRTNEFALGVDPWELREFRIFDGDSDAHHLREVTVKLTPDISLNDQDRLGDYVNSNAPQILAEKHVVPLDFPAGGEHFLGGNAPVTNNASATFHWTHKTGTVPIANPEARHKFSLNTCNGCHAGETNTGFTHVTQAPFGTKAPLSGFLIGNSVLDPDGSGMTRPFNDLERRKGVLENLVTAPCFIRLFDRPTTRPH